MRVPLIYKDGPLFGFDIGSHTVKLVQLVRHGKEAVLSGYAVAEFPNGTIVEGIIVDPDIIAEAVKPILAKPKAGKISAKRVAVSLPIGKVFIRALQLPAMSSADLEQAVRLEAEQYIPVPISDLFLDYEIISDEAKAEKAPGPTDKKAPAIDNHVDVLMVAAPQAIINSYIQLFDRLGLEIDSIEASLAAITRAMIWSSPSEQKTLVIDFGSHAVDLTIYDRVIRLTGTVGLGGDDLTESLSKKLGVSLEQASDIKYKFGIGPSGLQAKVVAAISDQLKMIASEIKKVIRFYEGSGKEGAKLEHMVLSGGGANMPGLNEYLAAELGLGIDIVISDPWNNIKAGRVPIPAKLEAPMYTTALGLALREMLRD